VLTVQWQDNWKETAHLQDTEIFEKKHNKTYFKIIMQLSQDRESGGEGVSFEYGNEY
jgi:hypothetical protein